MNQSRPSLFRRMIDRIVPKAPDFYGLLNEQCAGVLTAVDLLVEFMESGTQDSGQRIMKQEHLSDDIKVRNLQELAGAFSTPIDREDIYRAIIALDEVVNYCKTTVKEMSVLEVHPGKHDLDMAMRIREGVLALREGFGGLPRQTGRAAECCNAARKAERAVERAYRLALAELFQGSEYINMFKRREIYRHLSNTADRVATCADILHDITVKMG
jgi:uncharacterized protein Yka (UPF0111/DUF47 family)